MRVLSGLLLLLAVTSLLANGPIVEDKKYKSDEKEALSTRERARDMFREPSSEEAGKIPDKFQPIDHKIKTETREEKE